MDVSCRRVYSCQAVILVMSPLVKRPFENLKVISMFLFFFCFLGYGTQMAIFELLDYIVNEVRALKICPFDSIK